MRPEERPTPCARCSRARCTSATGCPAEFWTSSRAAAGGRITPFGQAQSFTEGHRLRRQPPARERWRFGALAASTAGGETGNPQDQLAANRGLGRRARAQVSQLQDSRGRAHWPPAAGQRDVSAPQEMRAARRASVTSGPVGRNARNSYSGVVHNQLKRT